MNDPIDLAMDESLKKFVGKILEERKQQNENEMRIHLYHEVCLRIKSTDVDAVNDTFKTLASQMLIFCNRSGGIGLAAPQIGINKRIIVIQSSIFDRIKNYDRYLFNPVISNASGEILFTEGCLSAPDTRGRVKRYASLTVDYIDILGKKKKVEWTYSPEDYWGIILQHEIDHLDGILYIDKLDFIQKDKALKTINKKRKK
jgi:peptide deformylase